MERYQWKGNVRQLKNITEQISIIEQDRLVTADRLRMYLPEIESRSLPALYSRGVDEKTFNSEREILYQVLFDMKKDMNDLKKLVNEIIVNRDNEITISEEQRPLVRKLFDDADTVIESHSQETPPIKIKRMDEAEIEDTEEIIEESLSLEDKEIELIQKALKKHSGKRKLAAQDLGISERTLYRKIKEYNIEE